MKQDERDMLIAVKTTVEDMKETQSRMENRMESHIQKDDTFLTKRAWMWATGFILMFIAGSYTYTLTVDQSSHKHQVDYVIHRIIDGNQQTEKVEVITEPNIEHDED